MPPKRARATAVDAPEADPGSGEEFADTVSSSATDSARFRWPDVAVAAANWCLPSSLGNQSARAAEASPGSSSAFVMALHRAWSEVFGDWTRNTDRDALTPTCEQLLRELEAQRDAWTAATWLHTLRAITRPRHPRASVTCAGASIEQALHVVLDELSIAHADALRRAAEHYGLPVELDWTAARRGAAAPPAEAAAVDHSPFEVVIRQRRGDYGMKAFGELFLGGEAIETLMAAPFYSRSDIDGNDLKHRIPLCGLRQVYRHPVERCRSTLSLDDQVTRAVTRSARAARQFQPHASWVVGRQMHLSQRLHLVAATDPLLSGFAGVVPSRRDDLYLSQWVPRMSAKLEATELRSIDRLSLGRTIRRPSQLAGPPATDPVSDSLALEEALCRERMARDTDTTYASSTATQDQFQARAARRTFELDAEQSRVLTEGLARYGHLAGPRFEAWRAVINGAFETWYPFGTRAEPFLRLRADMTRSKFVQHAFIHALQVLVDGASIGPIDDKNMPPSSTFRTRSLSFHEIVALAQHARLSQRNKAGGDTVIVNAGKALSAAGEPAMRRVADLPLLLASLEESAKTATLAATFAPFKRVHDQLTHLWTRIESTLGLTSRSRDQLYKDYAQRLREWRGHASSSAVATGNPLDDDDRVMRDLIDACLSQQSSATNTVFLDSPASAAAQWRARLADALQSISGDREAVTVHFGANSSEHPFAAFGPRVCERRSAMSYKDVCEIAVPRGARRFATDAAGRISVIRLCDATRGARGFVQWLLSDRNIVGADTSDSFYPMSLDVCAFTASMALGYGPRSVRLEYGALELDSIEGGTAAKFKDYLWGQVIGRIAKELTGGSTKKKNDRKAVAALDADERALASQLAYCKAILDGLDGTARAALLSSSSADQALTSACAALEATPPPDAPLDDSVLTVESFLTQVARCAAMASRMGSSAFRIPLASRGEVAVLQPGHLIDRLEWSAVEPRINSHVSLCKVDLQHLVPHFSRTASSATLADQSSKAPRRSRAPPVEEDSAPPPSTDASSSADATLAQRQSDQTGESSSTGAAKRAISALSRLIALSEKSKNDKDPYVGAIKREMAPLLLDAAAQPKGASSSAKRNVREMIAKIGEHNVDTSQIRQVALRYIFPSAASAHLARIYDGSDDGAAARKYRAAWLAFQNADRSGDIRRNELERAARATKVPLWLVVSDLDVFTRWIGERESSATELWQDSSDELDAAMTRCYDRALELSRLADKLGEVWPRLQYLRLVIDIEMLGNPGITTPLTNHWSAFRNRADIVPASCMRKTFDSFVELWGTVDAALRQRFKHVYEQERRRHVLAVPDIVSVSDEEAWRKRASERQRAGDALDDEWAPVTVAGLDRLLDDASQLLEACNETCSLVQRYNAVYLADPGNAFHFPIDYRRCLADSAFRSSMKERWMSTVDAIVNECRRLGMYNAGSADEVPLPYVDAAFSGPYEKRYAAYLLYFSWKFIAFWIEACRLDARPGMPPGSGLMDVRRALVQRLVDLAERSSGAFRVRMDDLAEMMEPAAGKLVALDHASALDNWVSSMAAMMGKVHVRASKSGQRQAEPEDPEAASEQGAGPPTPVRRSRAAGMNLMHVYYLNDVPTTFGVRDQYAPLTRPSVPPRNTLVPFREAFVLWKHVDTLRTRSSAAIHAERINRQETFAAGDEDEEVVLEADADDDEGEADKRSAQPTFASQMAEHRAALARTAHALQLLHSSVDADLDRTAARLKEWRSFLERVRVRPVDAALDARACLGVQYRLLIDLLSDNPQSLAALPASLLAVPGAPPQPAAPPHLHQVGMYIALGVLDADVMRVLLPLFEQCIESCNDKPPVDWPASIGASVSRWFNDHPVAAGSRWASSARIRAEEQRRLVEQAASLVYSAEFPI